MKIIQTKNNKKIVVRVAEVRVVTDGLMTKSDIRKKANELARHRLPDWEELQTEISADRTVITRIRVTKVWKKKSGN